MRHSSSTPQFHPEIGVKYAPPDDADVRPVHGALCLVHVRDALAEIELGVLLGCAALYLDEGRVGAGVALAALVAEDAAFGV